MLKAAVHKILSSKIVVSSSLCSQCLGLETMLPLLNCEFLKKCCRQKDITEVCDKDNNVSMIICGSVSDRIRIKL